MTLREKKLEFRTRHRKRYLRDRKLKRFENKSVSTVGNNNYFLTRKKPCIVVIYER